MSTRDPAPTRARRRDGSKVIVVGVDGSPGSAAALDVALAEGISRDATVEVVTAWLWNPIKVDPAYASALEAGRAITQDLQDRIVSTALGRLVEQHPTVVQMVVHDHPGRVLVARAEGSVMVVVGSGHQASASRKALGSIGEYCLRHSSAPVVVVPEQRSVDPPLRSSPGGQAHVLLR
jgi:nucleotide-binding universal stress UspA family protein